SLVATRSSMGMPATGINAFGMSRVSSPSRVPSPAARIIASMLGSRARYCIGRPPATLAVGNRHIYFGEPRLEMPGQPLGEVDGPVLPARASERYTQAGEAARQVRLDLHLH